MKMVIPVIALFTMINSLSVEAAGYSFSLAPGGDPELTARAKEVLPNIIKACPGLDRYAVDISTASVSIGHSTEDIYDNGLQLVFTVADKPKVLPKPLNIYSMKNNCYISITSTKKEMYIGKRACHSICDGVYKENDPKSGGRKFALE